MTTPATQREALLTKADVAHELSVTSKTVERWIAKGRASHGKDGLWPVYWLSTRVVRIPRVAVTKLLQRTQAPGREAALF